MWGHSDLDPPTSNHQNHSEPISAPPTWTDLETNEKNKTKPRNVCTMHYYETKEEFNSGFGASDSKTTWQGSNSCFSISKKKSIKKIYKSVLFSVLLAGVAANAGLWGGRRLSQCSAVHHWSRRFLGKPLSSTKDRSHPHNNLFRLLTSGGRFRGH